MPADGRWDLIRRLKGYSSGLNLFVERMELFWSDRGQQTL